MTIWILAVVVIVCTALAGWRQGGIRAAIAFAGILVATLLAGLVGKLFHLILPVFGTKNPLWLWALSPVCGFILVTILFSVVAFNVHRKVDVYYRYQAGDLRMALWQRLNSRLGICLGVLNGVLYFLLISFLVFNLAYFTTQYSAASAQKPSLIGRLANSLGTDLEASGFARSSVAVGKLSPLFYQFSDVAGFLMQNPQAGVRLANYPGLTSLWEQPDLQTIVASSVVTNAPAAGTPLGEVMNEPVVRDFLLNKDLRNVVWNTFATNIVDLTNYLETGKSAKYDAEPILGRWSFNPVVTLAWFRQNQPRIQAKEFAAVRALWTAAYGQTTVLAAGDGQLFIKNLPRFSAQVQPGQSPFTPENLSGDWSHDGESYTLHLVNNGQDKFLTATTADGLRLSIKDGRNLLIFDRAD